MRSSKRMIAGACLGLVGTAILFQYAPNAGSEEPSADPPLAEERYMLGDEVDAYASFMMSGGPPPDGIPAIDEPVFVDASEARLDPDDMIIGFVHEGDARAYPQNIMVHHEIVNDQVGGLNVAVTYCPLTATAQGFHRGNTTFGVSGQLLNSNLVMFDRATETYFSQINATGLRGVHRDRTLVEVNLTWTTWERWQAAQPDTRVLSERTGYLRNYANDPYGSYNPLRGYYAQDRTMFPLMHAPRRHHTKEMVVGGRTATHSAYFVLEDLAAQGFQATEHFLAVYDPDLDTAHIYRLAEEIEVRPVGDGTYRVGEEHYAADSLPLDPIVSVEAFYFAWNAFYPDSEHV